MKKAHWIILLVVIAVVGVGALIAGSIFVFLKDFIGKSATVAVPQVAHGLYTAGNRPGADRISAKSLGEDYSSRFSLALTAQNKPCVVWEGGSQPQPEILFACWNGTAYVGLKNTTGFDNLSNTAGESRNARLQIDSNGTPYVIWAEGPQIPVMAKILLVHWDGTNWSGLAGPGPDEVSATYTASDADIALNPQTNRPGIVWDGLSPAGEKDVFFKYWNGTAYIGLTGSGADNISQKPGDPDSEVDLEYSQLGRPNVSWTTLPQTSAASEILFSNWNGTKWRGNMNSTGPDNVTNDAEGSQISSLALDSYGAPAIAWLWYDFNGNSKVQLLHWSGSAWRGYARNTADTFIGSEPSLRINSGGLPSLAYSGGSIPDTDIYYAQWNGSLWVGLAGPAPENISNTAVSSSTPSIVLDTQQRPNFVWTEGSMTYPSNRFDILFSHWL